MWTLCEIAQDTVHGCEQDGQKSLNLKNLHSHSGNIQKCTSILLIKYWVKSDNEENIKQDKSTDYQESYMVIRDYTFEEMTFKQKLKLKIPFEEVVAEQTTLNKYLKGICDSYVAVWRSS